MHCFNWVPNTKVKKINKRATTGTKLKSIATHRKKKKKT